MTTRTMLLGPRDPILLRDARSFSAEAGARAFTLPWPLPRTVAGAIRTHIGNHAQPDAFVWNVDGADRARNIVVHGPLLTARQPGVRAWTVYLSAPRDFVALMPKEGASPGAPPRFMALRPWTQAELASMGAGCSVPDGLRPLKVTDDGKPDGDVPAFWALDDVWSWLTGVTDDRMNARPKAGIKALTKETRTHVKMDRATGTGEEGKLFSVEGIVFPDVAMPKPERVDDIAELGILARVETSERWDASNSAFLPLGGERRLASVRQIEKTWPKRKDNPANVVWAKVRGISLLLVTPALFTGGWLPDWATKTGIPPGCDLGGEKLTLVSAAVDRPIPVSGWDLEQKRGNAARFAASAGSVYFFELESLEQVRRTFETLLDQLWLRPISDEESDRREGFGLVLPGIW